MRYGNGSQIILSVQSLVVHDFLKFTDPIMNRSGQNERMSCCEETFIQKTKDSRSISPYSLCAFGRRFLIMGKRLLSCR